MAQATASVGPRIQETEQHDSSRAAGRPEGRAAIRRHRGPGQRLRGHRAATPALPGLWPSLRAERPGSLRSPSPAGAGAAPGAAPGPAASYLRRLGARATAPSCPALRRRVQLRTPAPTPAVPRTGGRLCACAPKRRRELPPGWLALGKPIACARGGLTRASHPVPIRIWEAVWRVATQAYPLAAARVLFHVANQSGRRGLARGQDGQSSSWALPRAPPTPPRSKLGRQSPGRRWWAAPVYRLTAAGGGSCGRLVVGSRKCR